MEKDMTKWLLRNTVQYLVKDAKRETFFASQQIMMYEAPLLPQPTSSNPTPNMPLSSLLRLDPLADACLAHTYPVTTPTTPHNCILYSSQARVMGKEAWYRGKLPSEGRNVDVESHDPLRLIELFGEMCCYGLKRMTLKVDDNAAHERHFCRFCIFNGIYRFVRVHLVNYTCSRLRKAKRKL